MQGRVKINSPETLCAVFGGDENNRDGFYAEAKIQLALNGYAAWQIAALRQAHFNGGLSGVKEIWDDIDHKKPDLTLFKEQHPADIEIKDENATILAPSLPVTAP
jgi:hypothetical protein